MKTTDAFIAEAFRVKQQRDDLLADQLSKAATIARLLYSNADLLAALRDIVEAYTDRFGRGHNFVGPIDEEIKAARAAIARAEE